MTTAPEISALNVLGIRPQDYENYSIRFNSMSGGDVVGMYLNDRGKLLEHMHTVRWGEERRWNIHTPRVLQFVQSSPVDNSKWIFVGGYVLEGEREDSYGFGNTVVDYKQLDEFAPFVGRLVVEYVRQQGFGGRPALTHNLRKEDTRRRVVENLVVDRVTESTISAQPFLGFEQARLTHGELVSALNSPEWKSALSGVSAVYLITDTANGWHYVGSAYSTKGVDKGLLSRWSEYAWSDDHAGGNKRLKDLGPKYIEDNFQYSILEVFDRRTASDAVIRREHWWMDTLGSVYSSESPYGYNSVREREES